MTAPAPDTSTAHVTRRRLLAGLAGATLFSGCSTDTDGPTPGPGPERTTTQQQSWMADANGYDGYENHRGESTVTVRLAPEGTSAFDPAGLLVSTGTRVVWEWPESDASHGVVERTGAFESDVTAADGHTFARTFDSSEIYRYYCPEHRAGGMKGAVLVQTE